MPHSALHVFQISCRTSVVVRRVIFGSGRGWRSAIAPGGRGSTAPGVLLPCSQGCSGWSARREGLQAGDRGGDLAGPGPSFGEPQPQVLPAAGESPGDGEQAQARTVLSAI